MELRENITGGKACYKTNFKFRKGLKYYKFFFRAYNSTFYSYTDKYNGELFYGDVCEVFIKYGKENHYYEVEVAPNGTIFLSDIENINGNFKGQLIENCFVKAKSKICKDCYKVTILIPKCYIKTDKLEFNAFRMDTDGEIPEKHLFALHPTMCTTFHRIESLK